MNEGEGREGGGMVGGGGHHDLRTYLIAKWEYSNHHYCMPSQFYVVCAREGNVCV